jgi:flagellar protein FlaG
MDINPSDMDVRQGYSYATEAASSDDVAKTQRNPEQSSQNASSLDERSQSVAAAADKSLAKEAAAALGKQLAANDTGLKIRVLDDQKNTIQVEVVDEQSNKVLRKIPQDDMVKLAASIKEMTGVILNKPA